MHHRFPTTTALFRIVRASAAILLLASVEAQAESGEVQRWKLLAFGDTSMAGSAAPEYAGWPVTMPFAGTAELISEADLTFLNLETSLTNRGQAADKKYTFRSKPELAQGLQQAGIDIVTLANNHSMDYGAVGLDDTLTYLREQGVASCGAGVNSTAARAAATTTVGDIRVAFVCYSNTFPEEFWATGSRPGTAFGHASWVKQDVSDARKVADVVIASFHWGAELMDTPKDYQIALAHTAIDAGAALVVGHHPHVLQGVEIYKDRPILYSIGNYAFGSYSQRVRDSAGFRVSFMGNSVVGVEAIPIDVYNPRVVFVPRLHAFADADRVSRDLATLSDALGTPGHVVEGRWTWTKDP